MCYASPTKDVIRHLRSQPLHHDHYLLRRGPLGLLTEALEQRGLSWDVLEKAPYAPVKTKAEDPDAWEECRREWRKVCLRRIRGKVAAWACREGAEFPKDSKFTAHFPENVPMALQAIRNGLPAFLKECGDLGRAGLRLLAPRYGSLTPASEVCVFCAEANSAPLHVLTCEGLPGPLQQLRKEPAARRDADRWAAARKSGTKVRRVDPDIIQLDDGYDLDWPGITPASLADHLWWVGHAIGAVCTRRFGPPVGSSEASGPAQGVPYLIGLSETEYSRFRRRRR